MRSNVLKAAIISVIPSNALRLFLYKKLLKYQFGRNCKVKPLTLIAVDSFEAGDDLVIGMLNFIKGPMKVRLGNKVWIGRLNQINSTWSIAEDRFAERSYAREFQLGDNCVIQHEHYFDVYGRFIVGNGSWIVGRRSQFWTHGLSVEDRDIIIGEGNVISTSSHFSPGSGIGNGNILGMMSLVTKRINVDNHIIAGTPAKPLRDITEDRAAGKYHFSRDDW